jgi:hypothetical protein
MAIMNPKHPAAGTKSKAEEKLFWALQKLPDSYRIFHSVKWYFFDLKRGKQEGEADFVIFDPDDRILVLEVKGGQHISYDANLDQWYSNGNKIDDPFEQGQRAEHIFLNQIKNNLRISHFIHIGHAVAFPETEVEDSSDMDKPREIILDENDMKHLRAWAEHIFEKMASTTHTSRRFSYTEREKIEAMIRESKEFNPSIRNYFQRLDQIVQQLTEEQFLVINLLRFHHKAAIKGCAGSGKTLVAIEKANRLNQAGFSVLLLCHNPLLAVNIRQKTNGNNITVFSFRDYVNSINGSPADQELSTTSLLHYGNSWSQFDEPSPRDLDSALDRLLQDVCPRYDAVIVDEGQDFKQAWWDVVEASLKEISNRILYVFFDDRQVLSSFDRSKIPVPMPDFDLSKNCRNTGEIYKLVQQLDYSLPETSTTLKGEGVVNEWIYSEKDEKELFLKIREAVLNSERYSQGYKDIVVLSGEIGLVSESRFNGYVFKGSKPEDSDGITPINWQETIRNFLLKRGFNIHQLSDEPYPTNTDKKLITDFARNWCGANRNYYLKRLNDYPNKTYPKTDSFHWELDFFGFLRLYSGNEVYESEEWPILNFLSRPDWTKTLPKPVKRYRLTPNDDFSKFDSYHNITLTNIPSFKGLEAGGIVFIYYHSTGGYDAQLAARLYVALSRARHLLNIVSPKSLTEEISRIKKRINL